MKNEPKPNEKLQVSIEHRVDKPHRAQLETHLSDPGSGMGVGSGEPPKDESPTDRAAQMEGLLENHVRDLIVELQQWSEQLDRREAELNARSAMVDHHQRKLRLEDQTQNLQIDEALRSLDRRRQELQNELRRIQLGSVNVSNT